MDKNQTSNAATEYANSIARSDERKRYCIEDFEAGAEWASNAMIEKAVDWLRYQLLSKNTKDVILKYLRDERVVFILEDFREAMEE